MQKSSGVEPSGRSITSPFGVNEDTIVEKSSFRFFMNSACLDTSFCHSNNSRVQPTFLCNVFLSTLLVLFLCMPNARDTVFCFLMHLFCSDLYFYCCLFL